VSLKSSGFWVLGSGPVRTGVLIAAMLVGCKAERDEPTPWEIIEGTADLTDSKAVHPTTRAPFADYDSRIGTLTIAADSSVTGWIRMAAGDTAFFTGNVVLDGDDWVMTVAGDLTPTEYTIITDGGFPTTYALLSTTILNGNVDGIAGNEDYRVYWEFDR
jgi:hypothetical protein